VTRRRFLTPALGALALVLAAGLAFAAVAVQRSAVDLRQADARFEVGKPRIDVWKTSGVSSRVGRRLLGTSDDLTFRRAARLFRLSQVQPVNYLQSTTLKEGTPEQLRAEASIALERLSKGDGDRDDRELTPRSHG